MPTLRDTTERAMFLSRIRASMGTHRMWLKALWAEQAMKNAKKQGQGPDWHREHDMQRSKYAAAGMAYDLWA